MNIVKSMIGYLKAEKVLQFEQKLNHDSFSCRDFCGRMNAKQAKNFLTLFDWNEYKIAKEAMKERTYEIVIGAIYNKSYSLQYTFQWGKMDTHETGEFRFRVLQSNLEAVEDLGSLSWLEPVEELEY